MKRKLSKFVRRSFLHEVDEDEKKTEPNGTEFGYKACPRLRDIVPENHATEDISFD